MAGPEASQAAGAARAWAAAGPLANADWPTVSAAAAKPARTTTAAGLSSVWSIIVAPRGSEYRKYTRARARLLLTSNTTFRRGFSPPGERSAGQVREAPDKLNTLQASCITVRSRIDTLRSNGGGDESACARPVRWNAARGDRSDRAGRTAGPGSDRAGDHLHRSGRPRARPVAQRGTGSELRGHGAGRLGLRERRAGRRPAVQRHLDVGE